MTPWELPLTIKYTTINWLRDLGRKQVQQGRPLYYECHYKPVDGTLLDAVAAFLVGVSANQYFGLGPWQDVNASNFSGRWVDAVLVLAVV